MFLIKEKLNLGNNRGWNKVSGKKKVVSFRFSECVLHLKQILPFLFLHGICYFVLSICKLIATFLKNSLVLFMY